MKKYLKPLIGIITALYYLRNPLIPKLSINNHVFTYETAITPEELMRGLSGRDPLPENHGMLFIYDHKEQYKFWMNEMKFPLDLSFILLRTLPFPYQDRNFPYIHQNDR
jgi:hypothetical protein